jgi:hypothetical protein
VALANKTARIAWAVMHRQESYQRMADGRHCHVMAQSVDPTQPREACRFIGRLIPFE